MAGVPDISLLVKSGHFWEEKEGEDCKINDFACSMSPNRVRQRLPQWYTSQRNAIRAEIGFKKFREQLVIPKSFEPKLAKT